MNILNYNESKEIISKLFELFNDNETGVIKEYLNSKSRKILFIILGAKRLPVLWYPQKPTMKYLHQIFDRVFKIKNYIHNPTGKQGYYHFGYTELITKITDFLRQEGVEQIYGVGNWQSIEIGNRTILISIDELTKTVQEFSMDDAYYFPKDFSWILAIGHHDTSFFAGSNEMMGKFYKYFPNYIKYKAGIDEF